MRRLPARLVLSALFLVACGGSGDSPTAVTPPSSPTIAVSLAPAAGVVLRGTSSSATVTLARGGGYNGTVTLSTADAPSGVQVTLSPSTLSGGVGTATATISVGTTVAPGSYTVTFIGTGTGVSSSSTTYALTVPTPPGVTVASIAAQQLAQGTSSANAVPLTLTRTGALAGDISLALEGAPSGVSATFTPNPATGTSTQMTLSASAAAVPGTYTLTVRASGAGGVSGTASFPLTVSAAEEASVAITAAPTALSVVQGQTGSTALNIARAGGFGGAVTLSATGLPTGTTATFTPATATGAQAQLAIVVSTATPVGSYPITVRAVGNGVRDATTTVALTVTPRSPSGTPIAWTFCLAERFPMWFAVQNGSAGAWTPVTPTGTSTRTYEVNVSGTGAVAYAIPRAGGGADVFVSYLTASEIGAQANSECTVNRRTKSLTGSVANLPAGLQAFVSVGGAGTALVSPSTTFAVNGAGDGTTDLVAMRGVSGPGAAGITADRGVLRRNVNYPTGSSIPLVDFNGSESFVAKAANVAILNAGTGELFVATSFFTANGVAGTLTTARQQVAVASQRVFGIPSANLVAGDQHQLQVVATTTDGTATSTRYVVQFNRELDDRTVTLGDVLPFITPTTIATAPYQRFSVSGLWQTGYGDAVAVQYTQAPTSLNSWNVSVSRGYAGAAAGSWTLAMPDLSSVAGFNTAWGLGAGRTTFAFTAFGGTVGNTTFGAGPSGFGEGGGYRLAARTGVFTP